jgi:hypothetical protein
MVSAIFGDAATAGATTISAVLCWVTAYSSLFLHFNKENLCSFVVTAIVAARGK